jgi:peptidoglycan/xylan/chitin deacetylase (PgdA/CDA1 family)
MPSGIDLPILCYHHVESSGVEPGPVAIPIDLFKRHLDVLVRGGFATITLSHLVDVLDGNGVLPRRPVILTFDDGFQSFAENAMPAILARNMTAIVFVLADLLGAVSNWDKSKGHPSREMMGEDCLRHVLKAGMQVGVHGCKHRDLTVCSMDELIEELVRSKQKLEGMFGVGMEHFCYPYGRYSKAILSIVAKAGYRAAAALSTCEPTVTSNRYLLRRIALHGGDTPWRFRVKLMPWFLRHVARREIRRGVWE